MIATAASHHELSKTIADRVPVDRVPGQERAYADAMLGVMRDEGFLSVMVPPSHGGPGLSVAETARITYHLARASGSVGLIYAMHMSQALSVIRHGGDSPFFDDFQRRMVRDQILIASGTSEKGIGGDIFRSNCRVEEGPAGSLRVAKESPNISYVDHAEAVLVSAMRPGRNGKDAQVLIVAEADRIAFTPGREAGFIGMCGMLNRSYALTATFEEEAIFPEKFPAIARATMTPSIHIFWAALWSGIARGALDKARLYVAKDLSGDGEVDQVVRHELTRLVNKHHTMNSLIRDAIAEYEEDGPGGGVGDRRVGLGFGLSARINRVKVTCSELLNEICHGALGLIGIRGYATGGPYSLSEPLRDALSAPLMVSNFRLSMNNAKIESFVDEGL